MHSFHMRRLTGTDIKANVGGRQTASRPNVALKKQTNKQKKVFLLILYIKTFHLIIFFYGSQIKHDS